MTILRDIAHVGIVAIPNIGRLIMLRPLRFFAKMVNVKNARVCSVAIGIEISEDGCVLLVSGIGEFLELRDHACGQIFISSDIAHNSPAGFWISRTLFCVRL